jgi:CBS domain containing-hemolysin-like protein
MMFFILAVSLLFVGFFAGVEIAFVSANKLSIELKKKQGRPSGIRLSNFLLHPFQFIGNNLVGFVLFFVLYVLAITTLLTPLYKASGIGSIDQIGLFKMLLEAIVCALLVLVVVYVFKAIFKAKSDGLLAAFSGLLAFFYRLFSPVTTLFAGMAIWMLKYIFNQPIDQQKKPFSRVDVEHYFQQTLEAEDDKQELNQELFENALSLPGVKVRSCLIPRPEIVAVEAGTPIEVVHQKMVETKLSKIVVYEGNVDNITGYVHQLDMFKNAPDLRAILLPIPAVPESMGLTDLMGKFSREHKSIAWVVDEFGGTAGIVTMEDLLEEIFGEIRDEYDTEEFVEQQLSETEYMFSGRLKLDVLNEKYNFQLPTDVSDTLSGFVILQNEAMPKQGDTIIAGNYQFNIINMSDKRIELLKMKLLGVT